MVVAIAQHRRRFPGSTPAGKSVSSAPSRPQRVRLPEPSSRVGPHGWVGKRVREDVRDGVAVAAFSLATSTGVSVVLFLLVRLTG